MSVRFTKSFTRTALAAAGIGIAAVIVASPASAGSTDDAFLAQLDKDGIIPPSSATAIKDAKAVCGMLDDGASSQAVYNAVAEETGLSAKASKVFAVDAASAYCPEYVTST